VKQRQGGAKFPILRGIGVLGLLILAACASGAPPTIGASTPSTDGPVWSVAWSPDGKVIASATSKGIMLYDSATLSPTQTIDEREYAESVSFSPDGTRLACTCSPGVIKIWNVESGQLLTTLSDEQFLTSVAFKPNGTQIAGGTRDGRVKVWDGGDYRLLYVLSGLNDEVSSLAYSADGERLLAGSGLTGTVKVWEASSGRLLHAFPDYSPFFDIQFSPDGTRMATSDASGETIRIWDVNTGQLLTSIEQLSIARFSFTNGGQAVVCLCNDPRGIPVWDAASGTARGTIPLDPRDIYSFAFSPDGTKLAVGTREGRVKNVFWGTLSPQPNGTPAAATSIPPVVTPTLWPTPDRPALVQLLVRYMSQHPPKEFSQVILNGKMEGYWQELGQVQGNKVQAYIVPARHPAPGTADRPVVIASVYDNGFTRASILFDGRQGQWQTEELPYTTDARVSKALRTVHGERDELTIAYETCGACSASSIAFDLWRWNGTAWEQIWRMPLDSPKLHGVLSFDQASADPGQTIQITYSSWQHLDDKSRLFAESNVGPHRYFAETWERDGDTFRLTLTRVEPSAYNALVEFTAALRSGDDTAAKPWVKDPALVQRAHDLGLDRMPEGVMAFPPGWNSTFSACHATAVEMCDQWQVKWPGSDQFAVGLMQQGDQWRIASIQAVSPGMPTPSVTPQLDTAPPTAMASPTVILSSPWGGTPALDDPPRSDQPLPPGIVNGDIVDCDLLWFIWENTMNRIWFPITAPADAFSKNPFFSDLLDGPDATGRLTGRVNSIDGWHIIATTNPDGKEIQRVYLVDEVKRIRYPVQHKTLTASQCSVIPIAAGTQYDPALDTR
jgi:hypothetical protein